MDVVQWCIVWFLIGVIGGTIFDRWMRRRSAYAAQLQKYETLEAKVHARLNER